MYLNPFKRQNWRLFSASLRAPFEPFSWLLRYYFSEYRFFKADNPLLKINYL